MLVSHSGNSVTTLAFSREKVVFAGIACSRNHNEAAWFRQPAALDGVHLRSWTPGGLLPQPSAPWTPLPDNAGRCTPMHAVDCRWMHLVATATDPLATLLTQLTNPGDQVTTLLPTHTWPPGSGGSWNRTSEPVRSRHGCGGNGQFRRAALPMAPRRAFRNTNLPDRPIPVQASTIGQSSPS